MQNNLIYKILKKICYKNSLSIEFIIDEKSITYKKFLEDCLIFSNYIKKKNFKNIGIIGDYEYLSYVSIFGTLISGKTYIPINQNLPIQKIKKIIKIAKIDLLSVSKNSDKKFNILKVEKINLENLYFKKISSKKTIHNFDIAYVIFTSGSTGEPKGVPISRENLYHYINWLIKNFKVKKNSRCSQFPNIGFDLSVVDIFSTICSGGTLVVPRNIFYRNFPAKFIKKNNITHTVFVPSFIELMNNSSQLNKNNLMSLKNIFFCGEALYKNQIEKLFKLNKNLKIINAYGPSETTVSCTKLSLNRNNFKNYCNDTVSIGKTIDGMKIKLLDNSNLKDKTYELLISGPQVFKGYLNNKILNKNKFIVINKKKYFKTGDLVTKIKGNIFFKKRIDNQIKIKGYRVELDEIDAMIRKFGIYETKTIFKNSQLKSFVRSAKKEVPFILKFLKKNLPLYMIPNSIIALQKFPKTINDKLDFKELI